MSAPDSSWPASPPSVGSFLSQYRLEERIGAGGMGVVFRAVDTRLNRAVAVMKCDGPEAALAMIEPLESALSSYFHFHGLRGG